MPFKVTSLNAKGLNHPGKRHSLWSDTRMLHCDVLCVQETHFSQTQAPSSSHKNFPHLFMANTPTKTKGALIAVKDTVALKLMNLHTDTQGRFIILVCEINNTVYTLVNLYVPNTGQISFLNKIWEKVTKLKQEKLILCGDFNLVPDGTIDVQGSTPKKPRTSTLLTFLHSNELYDIWGCQHASERDFTFFSKPHCFSTRSHL